VEEEMLTKRRILAVFLLCLLSSSVASQTGSFSVYEERRKKLMEKMDDGVAVFKNASVTIRNNDEPYPFRANSDFYYLTGCEESGAAFLLIPEDIYPFVMFVRPSTTREALWHGEMPGLEGAKVLFGADTVITVAEFEKVLQPLVRKAGRIYCDQNDESLMASIQGLLTRSQIGSTILVDVMPLVHEMRVTKDSGEVALLKKAIDITCDAHIEVMKAAEPDMFEYELGAIIDYVYRKNGSPRKGFQSIVGAGPRTTVLHYSKNDQRIETGDMILLDIGAEYGYYSADVTRTIPANGTFTQEQRDIYELVLKAQETAIEGMVSGNRFSTYSDAAERVIKEGLFALGLILDRDTDWQHLCYYFPYISHYLGLDVHDVGSYGGPYNRGGRVLEPGMVITVEPGLYIGENWLASFRQYAAGVKGIAADEVERFLDQVRPVFEKYENIGVRIEDDILITENGNLVLSEKAPKRIQDIERCMQEKSRFHP
jgi:Xaa-Pro aminopeptidase